MKLTKEQVLLAVPRACAPFSIYIADVLHKDHRDRVMKGEKGYGPTAALVLRRLKQLAAVFTS